MYQAYDLFNRQEKPDLTLCNPDKTQLYSLIAASKATVQLRYNALSEIEVEIPKEVNGVEIPGYDKITQKRVIRVGLNPVIYFTITDVETVDDGATPIKKVRGYSLEYGLVGKKLTAFGGTWPIYDILAPENSLMGQVLADTPMWTVNSVDASLLTKFRTFDVADTNIYTFLMGEVEEAYGCIFEFDTLNSQINIVDVETATSGTGIYLSHDNVVIDSTLKDSEDEITTALYVYGGGDLDIRTVNPLGTNLIYNFDYYKTTDWMSSGLISAITAWEGVIAANQAAYASSLSDLKTYLGELVVLEGELVDLNSSRVSKEGEIKVLIDAGQTYATEYAALGVIEGNITAKESEITNKESDISTERGILTGINSTLSFASNFTAPQITELSFFMFENTFQNENLVQLDSDDPDEVQDLAQALYDQGVAILERISQPRYTFDINAVSILALQEYSTFASQLELGSEVYIESDGSVFEVVLLEILLDYENPMGSKLVFSNRLRLDGSDYIYSDLFGQPVKTGSTVRFGNVKWSNWDSTYKSDVSSFIVSALDASVNNIINASNQEILIYENGLRARMDDGAGGYEPEEMWMTSNSIAFSDDNFQTASLAIGKITFNGADRYGIIAPTIVGDIIAGASLHISNGANNFVLNEGGCTLSDASFTVTRSDLLAKTVIEADSLVISKGDGLGGYTPQLYVDVHTGSLYFSGTFYIERTDLLSRLRMSADAFQIDKGDGLGGYTSQFYVDAGTGNVLFAGNLSAAGGTFSGALSAATGTFAGSLSAATGTFAGSLSAATGTFAGSLSAATGSFAGSLSAATGSFAGSLSAASGTFGGSISWSGATMSTTGTGVANISADDDIALSVNSSTYFRLQDLATDIARMYSAGDIIINASNDLNAQCSNDMNIYTASGYIIIDAGGLLRLNSGAALELNSTGNGDWDSGADLRFTSTNSTTINPGSNLYLAPTGGLYINGANGFSGTRTLGSYSVTFSKGICTNIV